MSSTDLTTGVAGKTIRITWRDGPTQGAVHDHLFHHDGTVEWHAADPGQPASTARAGAERPRYVDDGVASGIRLVSYLSKSGYTLTMVLNAQSGMVAGIASNASSWTPVHGAFEVLA